MGIILLQSLVAIILLSIIVLYVCQKIKLPTIVGFLLIGVLAGPKALGIIRAVDEVEILADIGIILLLFTIGIEFSLRNLFRIKKAVLFGGSLQVIFTAFVSYAIAIACGIAIRDAVFLGLLVSLSSTAIVLKLIQEKNQLHSPHGFVTLGILIFQDIAVVPMMLIIPILSGKVENLGKTLAVEILGGFAIVALVIVCARWVVPKVLGFTAKTKSKELFLLATFAICFTVAWLTSLVGLSIAMGAFLAGLIISESEYSHHALGNVVPFRDIFTSVFFVSIGMLLDLNFFTSHVGIILLISLAVLVVKTIIAGTVTALLGFPFRINMLVGLALSQIGEFSFLLLKAGLNVGMLSESIFQTFIAVSVITMACTPLIIGVAPFAVAKADKLPMPKWFKKGLYKAKNLD